MIINQLITIIMRVEYNNLQQNHMAFGYNRLICNYKIVGLNIACIPIDS